MGTSWAEVRFVERMDTIHALLARRGSMTIREIAWHCRCSPSTVYKVTKALMEQNRVKRAKQSFGNEYNYEVIK
jgi:predicted transcriptional regulator